MPKLKSQWEFGELFPAESLRRVFSVSELTASVKRLLEQQIGRVWVTGEVTNLRPQSSGHLYFSLKDGNAQLSCVLFRGDARSFNRDLLRDGLSINLQGDLSVYEARGQYQLIVSTIELQGVGALQAAFEKLKQKLQTEGLFAPGRKRPVPRYPRRIGIVTSVSGAAIRDVLQTIRRRGGGVDLVLASCRVQGQGAAEEIACAIELLNDWSSAGDRTPERGVDLILITRGGGSLEDLWAFNEERVARAIAASRIPVISAVGHEIDFTISDFVADLRAATPTAAAEIITEGYFASRPWLEETAGRLQILVRRRMRSDQQALHALAQRLKRQHPRRWLQEQWQRLDDLSVGLVRCARYDLRAQRSRWRDLIDRLVRARPERVIAQRLQRVGSLRDQLLDRATSQFRERQQRLARAEARLRLLSPQNTLDRGYSITRDPATQAIIRSPAEVQPGQSLLTRVKEGEIRSVVSPRDPR
jgi:exodeoxyribonuclease VII large subunit